MFLTQNLPLFCPHLHNFLLTATFSQGYFCNKTLFNRKKILSIQCFFLLRQKTPHTLSSLCLLLCKLIMIVNYRSLTFSLLFFLSFSHGYGTSHFLATQTPLPSGTYLPFTYLLAYLTFSFCSVVLLAFIFSFGYPLAWNSE